MRNCNLTSLDSTLWCFTFEPQRLYSVQGSLQSSFMTCILHTARISNVNSVMFVNRIGKLVSPILFFALCLTNVFFRYLPDNKSCRFFWHLSDQNILLLILHQWSCRKENLLNWLSHHLLSLSLLSSSYTSTIFHDWKCHINKRVTDQFKIKSV